MLKKKNIFRPVIWGVTADDSERPAIISYYNKTKGGTDIVDQKIGKEIWIST